MTEKVFYDSTHMAELRCPECGQKKNENVTGHLLSSVSPTITCTCECGHIYRADLEWKDSEDVGAEEKHGPEAASESLETSEPDHAEPLAMVSDRREAEESQSDDRALDGPLSMEGVGSETITCPNCQQEQSVSEKCLHCGIIFAKYRGDTPAKEDRPSGGGARKSIKRKPSRSKKGNKNLLVACAALSLVGLVVGAVFVYMHYFKSMTTDEIVAKTEGSIALIKHSEGNGSGFLIADKFW